MIKLESESQIHLRKTQYLNLLTGWCPDCRIIEPDLPRLEEKYNHFNFVSVDRN